MLTITQRDTTSAAVRPDVSLDSILQVERFAMQGYDFARESRCYEARKQDLDTLCEYAEATARDTFADDYDPAKYTQDAVEEHRYEATLREDENRVEARAFAVNDLHVRRAERDKLGRSRPEPAPNSMVMSLAIGVITISVSPSLHDLLWADSIGDPVIAWMLSIAFGSFVAAFIATVLLSTYKEGHSTPASRLGLVGAIGLGVALAFIRSASATGLPEIQLTIGLSLIEVASVLAIEWYARRLRHEHEAWLKSDALLTQAESAVATAERRLADRETDANNSSAEIEQHRRYVESRHIRATRRDDLVRAAVAAISRGYRNGINQNVTDRRGGIRRVDQ